MIIRKKAIGLLLVLLVLVSMVTPALAADSDFVINFGILTRYLGDGGDVVIPDGVTSIRNDVFRGNTEITSALPCSEQRIYGSQCIAPSQ